MIHLEPPETPAHKSPVAHNASSDQHVLNDFCFDGPEHPPCGSCFQAIDKVKDKAKAKGILPTGDAPCGDGLASVAGIIILNRLVVQRPEGEIPIRAPPSVPA